MKIQLLSDLHLEVHPHFQTRPNPGADVLVLAGDIGSYQEGSLLPDADFGLARFSPLHGWPVPVLYVPGNHEYDALDFDATHARLRDTCERLGITWLDREVLTLGGVRFVGTTLWTDFDALATATPGGSARSKAAPGKTEPNMTDIFRLREKAFRAANYYLRTTGSTRHGALMLAEAVRDEALACQQWLRAALGTPFDGKTVVVTHFAPSLKSADPRYGVTPGTAGFCNALDELLPLADLWLHGHLHAPSDYVARLPAGSPGRNCRVVANPLGYVGKGEQEGFREWLLVEV
jgi:predicted phosphodiesterase